MKPQKLTQIRIVLALVAGLAGSTSSFAQSASATISGVPVVGGYNYTITMLNTGGLNLNSFWYGWTDSGNNLPSNPSGAGNSLGWNNILDGNSIMWQNGGGGAALTPGSSGTFTFFSTSTPGAITTPPSGESVAYVGSIDFSQGVPGDSTGIFSPVLVAVPEPGSASLLAVSLLGLWSASRRKLRTL
jgi:hypothetical protein